MDQKKNSIYGHISHSDAKPRAEKVLSYFRKSNKKLELLVLQSYLEKFVEDKYLQTKGSSGKETFTIAKNFTPPNVEQPSWSAYKQIRR